MQNLIFFDKEGNPLNFYYNNSLERYEGDILFPENSNDTFKTQALYLFEKIPAFEYENTDLTLRKFQIFNEYGINFYQGVATQSITKIEPVNQESNYYSKWIYGKNIELNYKVGTFIRFNKTIFEFTSINRIYTVIGSKRGAILIISLMDNKSFYSSYSGVYSLSSTYDDITITGVNIIGIYNYISPDLKDNLSIWNEPDFYDRLYLNRKLNIVNSNKNDNYKSSNRYEDSGLVTVRNSDIFDIVHIEYSTSSKIPDGSLLCIEVITKTDLPMVYQGPINVDQYLKRLYFNDPIPSILKPGKEFKISNSFLNTDFFQVSDIQYFNSNAKMTYYATGSQVIYDNKIYQCIQSYTWSGVKNPIGPKGSTLSSYYWSYPTYLPISASSISGTITNESLLLGQIYLTSDHLYFTQSFTQSSEITFASAAQKFTNDFKILNIDLYYDSTLKADLIYPSNYAEVNFYHTMIGATYSIGLPVSIYEKAIEVEEILTNEFNYDYSSNFKYNLVFTDIDEFGIIIKINKMVYGERISYVYSSGVVDMERTIDKTLRNWLTSHFITLNRLGILPTLTTVGYSSVYYNAITLSTDFPNVPFEFVVKVGSTANFYIEHTVVTFNDIGRFLSVKLNDKVYIELFNVDIPTTLSNWVKSWSDTISTYGIYVDNRASALLFNVKKQNQRLDLDIQVGKSTLPGIHAFNITKKYSGNLGIILSSNEVILATSSVSLEDVGFSTGQIIGINKTSHTLQNIEFNSTYLSSDRINLSYEGPFWGLTDSPCDTSAFTTVAFTIGFNSDGCLPSFVPSLSDGMFDRGAFTYSFNIDNIFLNTYIPNQLDGVINMVDIVYVEPVNSIYVLGDSLRVFNSSYGNIIDNVDIAGITQSISLCFNHVSNYLYILTMKTLYKFDPYINSLIDSYTFSNNAYSIQLNNNNGDIYVSFYDAPVLNIYDINNSLSIISTTYNTFNIVFNSFESDMYVSTSGVSILRIDGDSRTIQTSYAISSGTNSIVYDPENEAIYAFNNGTNLKKIDNNIITDIPSVLTGGFNNLIFNNFNSTINSSTDILQSSLSVDTDSLYFTASVLDHGVQALNKFDGNIYIGGLSQIITVNTVTGASRNIGTFPSGQITKLIYNPDRKSIWGIQPATGDVIEIQVKLGNTITIEPIVATSSNGSFYGTLNNEYIDRDYLWLNVREYIRRPRENFIGGPTVSFYWKWFSDNVPEFFLYDFSGDQLPTDGILSYAGPKPLPTVILNRNANRDLNNIYSPEFQQTIFNSIENNLEFIDDITDVSVVPEPIQLFVGFNSQEEGPLRSVLQLYKKEEVDFTIISNQSNSNNIKFETIQDDVTGDIYGKITLDPNSTSYFTSDDIGNNRGLKTGQHIAIFISDITNEENQYISTNNGYLLKIRDIFSREIIVDYFKEVDRLTSENTIIENFPSDGEVTYLSCRFKVWNKEIGRFNLYGQTEIEDIRYHTELNNVGKLISSDDVYIFKEYDIKEEGIDWNYLNAKRKEMLMMRNMIYPYIGSYKSIINAINYFGYNDLELNEYYRNIDIKSDNYSKLFKVEIPDIFDNTVDGWTDNDFIKHTFPNQKYEDTNLLNLSFNITDREGNNVLYYSIEEVQKKLQGLKYWLQKNIIPITHKILDITGRVDFIGETNLTHQTMDVNIIKVNQNFTPITFDLNEAYLLPINSGSTVYNCVLDFYLNDYISSSFLPDCYSIDIRTYEVYREWYAFKEYQVGERAIYYDTLYESVIPNNKTNNPRKFNNANDWIYSTIYKVLDIVKYNRRFYVWSGEAGGTHSIISPILDNGVGNNWQDITEWSEIDLVPIDRISEYRNINNIKSYNFTVDSNITPYIVVEVTSDNGYGSIYTDRKNFEIKGILDIQEIESFTNLTTKQYRDATLPVVYADVSKVAELTMTSYPFTSGFLDLNNNYTNRPYLNLSFDIIYPKIKHGFPYLIGNSSSFGVNSFRIELGSDFSYIQNPYVITNKGTSYVLGSDLYWNGNLAPGSTVSVEVRGDVSVGGRAYYLDPVNSDRNQALVPLNYNISAKLSTGVNYGLTFSTSAYLSPTYKVLYSGSIGGGGFPISNLQSYATQSFVDSPMSLNYGGYSIDLVLSTFSQYGMDILTSSNNISFGTNFGTISTGFNEALKNIGYVYYQARVSSTKWWPYVILTSYYDMSLTSSTVLGYYDGSLLEVDYLSNDLNPLLGIGTNSTDGGITITFSYYPL